MEIKHYDDIMSIHFDSTTELLETECKTINAAKYGSVLSYNRGESWFGPGMFKSQDVINSSLLGWEYGLKLLQPMISTLRKEVDGDSSDYKDVVVRRKRKKTRAYQGDEVDIHKVYQGELDTAWRSMKRIPYDAQHRLVTLLIDTGVLFTVDAKKSLWRAAVAVLLADKLQAAGRSVRIIVGSGVSGLLSGSNSHMRVSTTITVKNYNEPLSLERLAAMSHAGFHRVFNFSARCYLEERINDSMGVTSGFLSRKPPAHIKEEIDEGHSRYIYLAKANSRDDAISSLLSAYQQMDKFSKELA